MPLKFIFFVSFALTGGLFYLSRGEDTSRPAKSLADAPTVIAEPVKAAEPKKKKDVKIAEAHAPVIDSYASLMPRGDIQAATGRARKQDFVETTVSPTIQSCYKDLIKRRKEIWKARDGKSELSFAGDVVLSASFHEGQLNFVRSRSSEIRDEKFHNCLETGMKQWTFPEAIASQPEWTYRRKISYDVNYSHDCRDGSGLVLPDSLYVTRCL